MSQPSIHSVTAFNKELLRVREYFTQNLCDSQKLRRQWTVQSHAWSYCFGWNNFNAIASGFEGSGELFCLMRVKLYSWREIGLAVVILSTKPHEFKIALSAKCIQHLFNSQFIKAFQSSTVHRVNLFIFEIQKGRPVELGWLFRSEWPIFLWQQFNAFPQLETEKLLRSIEASLRVFSVIDCSGPRLSENWQRQPEIRRLNHLSVLRYLQYLEV